MRRLFFLLFFTSCFVGFSVSQTVAERDSVRKLVEEVIRKKQDSLAAAKEFEAIKKSSKPLDAFLQEMREKEQAEKRRLWLRIAVGVFFFSLVLLTAFRRFRARRKT